MTVRSTLLAVLHVTAAGWSTPFTCPTGWRAIVKSILLDTSGGPGGAVNILLGHTATGAQVNLEVTSVAGNTTQQWNGWVVMNPGDTLSVYSAAPPLGVWMSGTLLQLTGGEPM